MTETHTDIPPGRVALAPGELACDGCGRVVPAGEDGALASDVIPMGWGPKGRLLSAARVGRCPACAALWVHARAVVGPDAPDAEIRAVVGALEAFRVQGRPLPDPGRVGAGELRRWFGRFELGWSGRLFDHEEMGNTAAAEAWAHIGPATRAAVAGQFARWAHVRARPGVPLRIVAPPPGGCLMCGVGHVEVPAEVAADADPGVLWRTVTADPAVLGGRGRPRLSGALCGPCVAAADDAELGALVLGPTALERALATWWDGHGHSDAARWLRAGEWAGVVGWGALPGRPANTVPWDHVALPVLDEAPQLDAG